MEVVPKAVPELNNKRVRLTAPLVSDAKVRMPDEHGNAATHKEQEMLQPLGQIARRAAP
jgi:hypothetical protein